MKKQFIFVLFLLALAMNIKAQAPRQAYSQPTIEFNINDIALFDERIFFIYNLVNDGRFDVKTSEEDGVFLINANDAFESMNLAENFAEFRQHNASAFSLMDKEQAAETICEYKSQLSDDLILSLMMDIYTRSRQNNTCATAEPFCTDNGLYQFPAGVNAGSGEAGPAYDCLYTQPNPAWYYMQIANPGNIDIYMYSTPSVDIDFCCWGPFADPSTPCTSGLTQNKVVSCSYSTNPTEHCMIPATAQTNDYFILIITNYSNQNCNISFSKVGGTGTTDCGILPPLVNNDGPYCTGDVIHLTANGQAGSTYSWTGPDGWTSTSQNPTRTNVTTAMSGTYTCTISLNGQTNSATTQVVVSQRPTANFTFTSVCKGTPTQFTATTSGNPSNTSYTWNFGDGQTANGATVTHLYNRAGNYPVVLTAQNPGTPCSSTKNMTVTVYEMPAPTASANPMVVQYGGSSSLSAQSGASGSFTYHWEPANKVTNPNSQNTTTVGLTETTTFTVTVTNPQGGCSAQANVTVSMNGSNLNASPEATPAELCEGESTTLHANPSAGTGNYTITWDHANTLNNPNIQDPVATPPVGQTTYTCHITDGVTNIDRSVTVTVHPNEIVEYERTICDNDSIEFFGEYYHNPDIYEHIGQTEFGCEKTFRMILSNNETYDETVITEYICSGESYPFNGHDYTESTNPATTYYVDETINGCDSIVRLALTVYPPNDIVLVDPTICESQSYNFHGTLYSHDGDIAFFDTIDNHGCPLTEKLVLSVGPYQMPPVERPRICYPYDGQPSYYWDKTDKTYNEDTYDEIILPDPQGDCDIMHRLDLKFHKEFYKAIDTTVCDAFFWDVNGQRYTETEHNIVAAYTTSDQFECDSIYVLDLTINKSNHDGQDVIGNACDSVIWNNMKFISNGDYPYNLSTTHNCDSTVTLHIRNMEYTPTPEPIQPKDWNTPAPHWVIPATEFQINTYHYTIWDNNPNCSWENIEWSCEGAPTWIVRREDEDNPHPERSSYVSVTVLDRMTDTIWLTARITNRCTTDTIVKQYFLVSSFYNVDDQYVPQANFNVVPNPNNGQMTLSFENFIGNVNVKVYNMNGLLIDNFETNGSISSSIGTSTPLSTQSYNMKNRVPGIYLFIATGKEGTVTKKVVVTR